MHYMHSSSVHLPWSVAEYMSNMQSHVRDAGGRRTLLLVRDTPLHSQDHKDHVCVLISAFSMHARVALCSGTIVVSAVPMCMWVKARSTTDLLCCIAPSCPSRGRRHPSAGAFFQGRGGSILPICIARPPLELNL